MTFRAGLVCFLVSGLLVAGCGSDDTGPAGAGGKGGTGGGAGGEGGTGGEPFIPPSFGTWEKYEPDGAVCANGSQYKFFVNFSETSDNVIIFLEGGGACWDYKSCTGTGIRSAANKDGISDDHATKLMNVAGVLDVGADIVYPLLSADPDASPFAEWNKVFVPYCTGDIYAGDTTIIYTDPDEIGDDVEFHHRGHANVLGMIDMLSGMFPTVPRMFVGGCSAGGVGALVNYYFFRTMLNVEHGYLLDDSGPIFPDSFPTSRSRPLHDRVRLSWNVDPLIDTIEGRGDELMEDFGNLSTVLADEFPNDRLASTQFQLDYNFSLYSYERFYTIEDGDGPLADRIVPFAGGDFGVGLHDDSWDGRAAFYSLWWDDNALLRTQYDEVSNLGYYHPYFRRTNSSHCATIPGFEDVSFDEAITLFATDFGTLAWLGTEMSTDDGEMNLHDYVEHLIDDGTPLESYVETESEGHYKVCAPSDFDAEACEAAVASGLPPLD